MGKNTFVYLGASLFILINPCFGMEDEKETNAHVPESITHHATYEKITLDINVVKTLPTNRWHAKIGNLLRDNTREIYIDLDKFYSDNLRNINFFLVELPKNYRSLLSLKKQVENLVYTLKVWSEKQPDLCQQFEQKLQSVEGNTFMNLSEDNKQQRLKDTNVEEMLASFIDGKDVTTFNPLIFYRNQYALQKLFLLNATSYKFNVLLVGIKTLFAMESMKEITYQHRSKTNPSSARKELESIEGCRLSRGIQDGCHTLILQKKRNDEDDNNYAITDYDSTISSLETNILDEEYFSEEEALREELRGFNEANIGFPPFNLSHPNQILEVTMDDFSSLEIKMKKSDQNFFLTISGVVSADVIQIARFCEQYPRVRCLRIIDSDCTVDILRLLLDNINKTKIQYIDVRSALKFYHPSERLMHLKNFFEMNEMTNWSDHFVWCSQEEEYIREEEYNMLPHKIFWLIERWIEHIKRI